MTQTVVHSGTSGWNGATNTTTVNLTGVTAGNAIDVRMGHYGDFASGLDSLVSDGTNTYQKAAHAFSGAFSSAEIWYAENVAGGNFTVQVILQAAPANSFGWLWIAEIAGRATSGSLMSGATGTNSSTSSNAPTVVGGGAITQAGLIVAVVDVNASSSNVGLSAAAGNSLTWTNRTLQQDSNAVQGTSIDDAPASSIITPSVNWGTLTGNYEFAAAVAAFKDATTPGTMKTVETLARANIKTIKALAIASVKTFNGLTP